MVQSVDSGGCEHKLINTNSFFSYYPSVLPDLTLCVLNQISLFFFAEISVFKILLVFKSIALKLFPQGSTQHSWRTHIFFIPALLSLTGVSEAEPHSHGFSPHSPEVP